MSYPNTSKTTQATPNQQISYMITANARVPFGKIHKGKKMGECPTSFLQWMVDNLTNGDLHEYAYVAKKMLVERRKSEKAELKFENLEKSADAFLESRGLDKWGNPKKKQ